MKTKNVRTTLAALLTAALLLVPAVAWGQATTKYGVVVGSEKVTAVQDGTNAAVTSENYTAGTAGNDGTRRVDATQGNTVTVTVADADDHTAATPKVAKVIVTQTNVKAETITVTSAGDATEMNGNAKLQMSASLSPTYTDNKTVTWSVAPASGSSATATINATTGLLTAGTTQGNVVVTATATNGTDDTSDDITATKTITITTIPLTAAMIQNISAMTYKGEQLKPTVTVKDGSKTLTLNTDYTVSYGANVNAGDNAGSVTVTGIGAYVGSASKNFTINKADGYVTLSSYSSDGWYAVGNKSVTVNISHHGGNLTVNQSDGGVDLDVSISGNVLNIRKKFVASVVPENSVTVISAATTNYNEAKATYYIKP